RRMFPKQHDPHDPSQLRFPENRYNLKDPKSERGCSLFSCGRHGFMARLLPAACRCATTVVGCPALPGGGLLPPLRPFVAAAGRAHFAAAGPPIPTRSHIVCSPRIPAATEENGNRGRTQTRRDGKGGEANSVLPDELRASNAQRSRSLSNADAAR